MHRIKGVPGAELRWYPRLLQAPVVPIAYLLLVSNSDSLSDLETCHTFHTPALSFYLWARIFLLSERAVNGHVFFTLVEVVLKEKRSEPISWMTKASEYPGGLVGQEGRHGTEGAHLPEAAQDMVLSSPSLSIWRDALGVINNQLKKWLTDTVFPQGHVNSKLENSLTRGWE